MFCGFHHSYRRALHDPAEESPAFVVQVYGSPEFDRGQAAYVCVGCLEEVKKDVARAGGARLRFLPIGGIVPPPPPDDPGDFRDWAGCEVYPAGAVFEESELVERHRPEIGEVQVSGQISAFCLDGGPEDAAYAVVLTLRQIPFWNDQRARHIALNVRTFGGESWTGEVLGENEAEVVGYLEGRSSLATELLALTAGQVIRVTMNGLFEQFKDLGSLECVFDAREARLRCTGTGLFERALPAEIALQP